MIDLYKINTQTVLVKFVLAVGIEYYLGAIFFSFFLLTLFPFPCVCVCLSIDCSKVRLKDSFVCQNWEEKERLREKGREGERERERERKRKWQGKKEKCNRMKDQIHTCSTQWAKRKES